MKFKPVKNILLAATAFLAAQTMNAQTTSNAAEDPDTKYAAELLKPGSAAPDFTLPSLDGKTVSLSDYRGRTVVLDFWASWCPDCRKDIPKVKALHEKYGKKVEFIGVSFDVDRDRWAKCVADNGMAWRQVSELKKMREAKIAAAYGVQWIPSMTLIGPDGKVVLSTVVIERMEKALGSVE